MGPVRMPWLALGAGAMFVAAAGLPLWGVDGPALANLGELAFALACVVSAVRFAHAPHVR